MKKIFLNRLSAFLLVVMILFVSVGDAFISVNNISVSHAVGPAFLGYDIMYEICQYFGSMYLGYSATREIPEVYMNDDDIARIGYQVIKVQIEDGWYSPFPSEFHTPWRADAAVFGALVEGQQYVFGSEALQQVAETEFTVIQGGKNDGDGDDDDDDEENNIIHFPKKIGDTFKKWFALTATGAAAFAEFISSEYQKWLDGDEESILSDIYSEYFDNDTFSDYESIRNADGTYNVTAYQWQNLYGYRQDYIGYETSLLMPFAVGSVNSFQLATKVNSSDSYFSLYITTDSYVDGVFQSTLKKVLWGSDRSGIYAGTNVPIFSSFDAAYASFKSGDYSDALNYAKTYRIADWLQDDWSGTLLDPLTGLNALSNLYNIARHQGLNALGADATADDLADYIRDYFAELGTDVLPEVDPSLAPVKFPSTVEDVVVDPSANPAVYPTTGTDPGTSPGTGTDPGTNPGGGTGSDMDVDMDENDYKVDLRTIFPFCIPFDFVALLNVLDADPVAPRFDFPVVIPALNYQQNVTLDMSMFDDVAKVIRICEKVSFLIFLMFVTSKVIRW